jgi:hypothetical protein
MMMARSDVRDIREGTRVRLLALLDSHLTPMSQERTCAAHVVEGEFEHGNGLSEVLLG